MEQQENQDSALAAILGQYEDSKKNTFDNKRDLSNYLSTRLPDGKDTGNKNIRILAGKDGDTPFKEIHIHKIKVGDYWRKYICPKKNLGKPCPFCDTYDTLRKSSDDDEKTLAKDYSAKKAYVARVIDRDNEDDGVKFWRFNHDYRGEGIFDKLIGIFQAKGDITNPRNGRDVTMTLNKNKKGATIISGFVHDDITLLTDSKEKAEKWLNDERTWEDVYGVKPYGYLELIIKGKQPVWSKAQEKYVDRDELDSDMSNDVKAATGKLEGELNYGSPTDTPPVTSTTTEVKNEPTSDGNPKQEEEDDDLPF